MGSLFRYGTAFCFLVALASGSTTAHTQTVRNASSGCVQEGDHYVCSWQDAAMVFRHARTVALDTPPQDRAARRQLAEMLVQRGKTEADLHSADLTLQLSPLEPAGVSIGPADRDLAQLRLYAPHASSGKATLLWVETLRGPGDRPWPAQVHALLQQFQARLPALP